jgi:hypothetical protein
MFDWFLECRDEHEATFMTFFIWSFMWTCVNVSLEVQLILGLLFATISFIFWFVYLVCWKGFWFPLLHVV